jgi:hypothetical protein
MTEICECGFSKEAHTRRDFFKKQKINMIFADRGFNIQPCKKFKPKKTWKDFGDTVLKMSKKPKTKDKEDLK